jgi:hypothetical protein
MIACLVIATTPSGHWIGFDALVFGARRRRQAAATAAASAVRQPEQIVRAATPARHDEQPIALDP